MPMISKLMLKLNCGAQSLLIFLTEPTFKQMSNIAYDYISLTFIYNLINITNLFKF